MDIQQILADKTTYPDEMKWDMGNGVTVTVGDLRTSTMSKGAVQDIEKRYAKEKQELQQAYQIALTNVQAERQQAVAHQAGPGADELQPFLSDPYWEPLARRAKQSDALMKKVEMLEARIHQDEQAVLTDRYSQVLRSLKEKDPELDMAELAAFAQSRQIYNLDDAYRLKTEDRRMAKTEKEAEDRGYKKAKAEPPLPPLSSGTVVMPSTEAPKSVAESFDALKRDPLLHSIYQGT